MRPMKFLDTLTLGKKIFLLLALGLVVGIGLFSFLGIRAVNQATDAMLADRLTTANLVAGYLDETLGHTLAALQATAGAIGAGTQTDPAAAVEGLEETFSGMSFEIHSAYIIDEQGMVLWSLPESLELNGTYISYYPGVNEVVRRNEAYVSGLVSEPVTNTPVILLEAPIIDVRTQTRHMLVVAVDINRSSIGGFIQHIMLGETGYAEIVDQNGVVVIRTEPGPVLSPFEKSDHSGRFAALIAAGQPTQGLCHTCHEPVQKVERRDVLAFVPLTQASWGVVIRQSESEALAPVQGLRQSLIIFGTLLAALATTIVIITTRDVISRLRMLTTASKRIAGGDLDSRIVSTSQDEVGMLAGAFEDMRSRLKTNYGELEQRTKELSYLLAISEMLSRLPALSNLDKALGSVMDKTLEIIKEPIGAILLLDDEKQVLTCQVNRGLYRKRAPQCSFRLDEGISSQAVHSGKVITTADISRDRSFDGPEPLVDGLRGFVSIPLLSQDKITGVMNVASPEARRFSAEDIKLLEGIARQATAAIENARLHREVRYKEAIRGELLQDVFSIQEEERKRIARELHDETSQVIASLTASLEATLAMLPPGAEKARGMLEKTRGLSINILDEIHRLIYELRPSLLDDLGLVAAARWLAEVNLEASGINVSFDISGRQRRLPPRIEATLFRVIQEAVNNISRHARARNAAISLGFKRNAIQVRIRDDGRGFDVDEAISSRERPRGLGLLGMKERISIVSGKIDIESHPGGGGTEIIIEIPLNKEAAGEQDKSTDS
jgi:signal transduction histidine kinase